MKLADSVEKICDKNIIADEPLEVLNISNSTRFDGAVDKFVKFNSIVLEETENELDIVISLPIFPATDFDSDDQYKNIILKHSPKEHKPQNKGRYSKYLK